MKKLYILNGGAPEKITYFTELRSLYPEIDFVIMDNNGDDSNNLNFELIRDRWDQMSPEEVSNEKILITSEFQLDLLSGDNWIQWAKAYDANLLYLKSYQDDEDWTPSRLCSKELFTKLPTLGLNSIIMTGSEIKNTQLDLTKYVVKKMVGTGAGGVIMYKQLGSFKPSPNKVDSKDTYLLQPIYDIEDWCFYTVPAAVSKGDIIYCAPLLGSKLGFFSAKWKTIQLDTTRLDEIRNALLELISTFNLSDGIFEPEFAINRTTGDIRIIDFNPRWSFDCSVIDKVVREALGSEDVPLISEVLINNKVQLLDSGIKGPIMWLGESYSNADIFMIDKDERL